MFVYLIFHAILLPFSYSFNFLNESSGFVVTQEGYDPTGFYPSGTAKQIDEQTPGFQADQNLCPERTVCTVLTDCRLLLALMDRSCLVPNRLKELTCGYRRNEPMVCCPRGGSSDPYRPHGGSDGGDGDGSSGPSKPLQESGLNQNCGRPQLNGWTNGYSGLGSQPWVARIVFKNSETGNTDHPCCGSIITSKVVLTAAHCALAQSEGHSLTSVRVGEYDMRGDPDCTNSFCAHPVQIIDVSHVVVHPGFEKSNFRHDVALLVLKQAMNYSLAVQPICLLQNPTVPLVGRRARLVGWGKLPDEERASLRQQQLELPIQNLDQCSKIYGRVIPVTTNQLCVGGEAKKDGCSGFGGAPLVLLDHVMRDRYYQVGMVSFGSDKCGTAGVPSVYTHIQHYYDWIKTNIPTS